MFGSSHFLMTIIGFSSHIIFQELNWFSKKQVLHNRGTDQGIKLLKKIQPTL